jgi:hypothetical protein
MNEHVADAMWHIDRRCTNCDAARQLAPGLISEVAGRSSVIRQPRTQAQEHALDAAAFACHTRSIRRGKRGLDPALDPFPLPLTEHVHLCGRSAGPALAPRPRRTPGKPQNRRLRGQRPARPEAATYCRRTHGTDPRTPSRQGRTGTPWRRRAPPGTAVPPPSRPSRTAPIRVRSARPEPADGTATPRVDRVDRVDRKAAQVQPSRHHTGTSAAHAPVFIRASGHRSPNPAARWTSSTDAADAKRVHGW